ncbi:pilus assembly protein CpaE [Jannaschia pagri]|uniref:Pilus assembly protein CpaE n=1 Tax=Jannaschia pagri TaxID=2829797 RepID=A0ABQ4NHU8_9RHOB|nr:MULTISPECIES: AAA family ATPase [unclassified Jannaschia]GIT89922.1 pilus assembly protein CpaE [Jannaschia sp. AI_61]GIT93971.1 pilus assembly protein CpaE [Jannaschia sp. AI_62]
MPSNLATLPEPEPLRAVTVSRDVQEFDLLIEDMEAELGEAWGDLTFTEATAFLKQPDAAALEFLVIAADRKDEAHLPQVVDVVRDGKAVGLKIILVAEDLTPMALHELLRAGADDFAPYPLPEQALSDAVARLRAAGTASGADALLRTGSEVVDATAVAPSAATGQALVPATTGGGPTTTGPGALFALQSASGGNGATTVAVNLAWELANVDKVAPPRVCLIDLGLQFGSVSTYLDLPRKDTIYDVLTDIASMDEQAFRQTLSTYEDKLSVFTAPAEVLPLDVVGPTEIARLLDLARNCFDVVIVDLPGTVTGWTETVLEATDIYFMVCALEVRAAQNALRFQRLLQSEGIATDRIGYLLNKAPGRLDMQGRGRIDKFADSLGIKFHAVLSDGGKQVTEVNDQAAPLRVLAARNALTKDIAKLAGGLHEARKQVETGATAAPKKKAIFGLKFG